MNWLTTLLKEGWTIEIWRGDKGYCCLVSRIEIKDTNHHDFDFEKVQSFAGPCRALKKAIETAIEYWQEEYNVYYNGP